MCCVCLVGSLGDSYGFGSGSLRSLARLLHAPSGGHLSLLLAASYSSLPNPRLHNLHHQERGIALAIQYPPWAQPNIIQSFASRCAWAMEGAQVAAFYPLVHLRLVQGPGLHTTAVI